MKALSYYLCLPFLYLVSLLPFPLLYLLSDMLFVLLFYVLRYRRKIVSSNLKRSFPSFSEKERQAIERRFYRYFCDLLLETFKTLTFSPAQASARCRFDAHTVQLFDRLDQEKRSFIIVMGHFGNWEWAGSAFSLRFPQPLYVIYHPLSNPYFDRLIYRMRTRFGTRLYAMKDTFREMVKNRREVNATAFIADQTPSPERAWWTTFLHQDTPIFMGTEKIAQKLNLPVVYVSVNRKKRGYYEISTEMLTEHPETTQEGEITELHTRKLEKDILHQPEIWLWSHRRWKHKRTTAP